MRSVAVILFIGSACAAAPRPTVKMPTKAVESTRKSRGSKIAAIAASHVNQKRRLRRYDCSGFVETVLSAVGTNMRASTKMFYADAHRNGRWSAHRPQPGDLAFFDYTYDANRNGQRDDRLSHIAIVTHVYGDGRVRLAHRGGRGVRSIVLSLDEPHRHKRDSVVLNDYLAHRTYAGRRARLTGSLLRGFARPPSRRNVDPLKRIAASALRSSDTSSGRMSHVRT